MFSHSNWIKICEYLSSSENVITAESLKSENHERWVILKHDVETDLDAAVQLARIESSFGLKATYYVQGDLIEGNLDYIKVLIGLGHEVSIHYDVLDSNEGDYLKALEEFEGYVSVLRTIGVKVNTVCPHGNPILERNGWNSNKDFFRNNEVCSRYPEILDIVVHSQQINGGSYVYISDAGYQFKVINGIDSNDINQVDDTPIGNVDSLVALISAADNLIISTHPHRWSRSSFTALCVKWRFYLIRRLALELSKSRIIKKILSRFYYVARKY